MKKLDYVIAFVGDMNRSVAFYRDVLGFTLRFEHDKWTEFDTGGTTLALHPAAEPPAPTGYSSAGRAQLGLVVDDLDAFHRTMQTKDVRCIQPPKVEDFGGRLAVYADPDGLPFSVAERPKK
jgi:lactoylglutathione lyase